MDDGRRLFKFNPIKFNSFILPPKVWRARADGVLGRPGQMVVAVKTLRGNDKLCSLRQYELSAHAKREIS